MTFKPIKLQMEFAAERHTRDGAPSGWVGEAGDVLSLKDRILAHLDLLHFRRTADPRRGTLNQRLARAQYMLFLRELLRRDEEGRAANSCALGDDGGGRQYLRLWPDRKLWAPAACPACGWTREKELELQAQLQKDPTLENRPYEEVLARMPREWRVCSHPEGLFWKRTRALWELAPPTTFPEETTE